MTQTVQLTTRAEREALRAIRRACAAGLDSVTLRQEVARHAEPVLPSEACGMATIDPDTGLFTHAWLRSMPEGLIRSYMRLVYPFEAEEFIDRARTGMVTKTEISEVYQDVLRSEGLEYTVHSVLCSEGEIWGSWCLFREPRRPGFGDDEARFLAAVSHHVGHGMRRAVLLEEAEKSAGDAWASVPGVIVLDPRDRLVLRSGPAAAQLGDLASVGISPEILPYSVVSLLVRLRSAPVEAAGLQGAELRAKGRSGRWYVLRGSLAEPDASGASSTVIVIEPSGPRRGILAVAQRYGLTPREREVLRHALQGDSTKRIAARLGLSVHTVKDHLDHAGAKVGARGRRALLAKLFVDRFVAADPPAS
jgi:DNA-binding CsgD family transcriptional regulator